MISLIESCVVFSPGQAADGWAAEATGDWGAEESWESVDGSQGKSIGLPPSSETRLFLIGQNELQTDVTFTLSWTFYKNPTICLSFFGFM